MRRCGVGDDVRLLVKVATLYYRSQYSQSQIAERLGLSRQTVGRLLQRASDTGIVHIEIRSPLSTVADLERQLEDTFNLLEAVVVSPSAETDDAIKQALGEVTAAYLTRRLKDGDVLGIVSGSTTLHQCALHLERSKRSSMTVVALTGSAASFGLAQLYADSTVLLIGRTLGAKTVLMPAPAFVDRPEIKATLMSDSNIAGIIDLGRRANIALFGIGTISERSSPYQQGFFGDDLLAIMREEGAVGEICGHAFDLHGAVCSPEISARTIAIELDSLKTKELSIAVAGGAWKADAMLGVLNGRYCNVFITDEGAARALLERRHADGNGQAMPRTYPAPSQP
jgi:deoxyribonucleoside regulator